MANRGFSWRGWDRTLEGRRRYYLFVSVQVVVGADLLGRRRVRAEVGLWPGLGWPQRAPWSKAVQ